MRRKDHLLVVRRTVCTLPAATASLVLCSTVSAQTALPVPNPGFEAGAPQVSCYSPVPRGQSLGGWIAVGDGADYMVDWMWGCCPGWFNTCPFEGSAHVRIGSNNGNTGLRNGIECTLEATPGHLVEMRFHAVSTPYMGFTAGMEVSVGDRVIGVGPTASWQLYSARGIAAANGTVRLGFRRYGGQIQPNIAMGPYIDAVEAFDLGPDCNQNLVPDSTELDCNANGQPDSCDIAANPADDCNTNGELDECEIAASKVPDCNHNLVPDSCDLLSGFSTDLDQDSIPDECGCPPDVNGDRAINGADLGIVLGFWGPASAYPRADIDRDGFVNGADLAILLNSWGACP